MVKASIIVLKQMVRPTKGCLHADLACFNLHSNVIIIKPKFDLPFILRHPHDFQKYLNLIHFQYFHFSLLQSSLERFKHLMLDVMYSFGGCLQC